MKSIIKLLLLFKPLQTGQDQIELQNMLIAKAKHTFMFTNRLKLVNLVGCSFVVNKVIFYTNSTLFQVYILLIYKAFDYVNLELSSPYAIPTDSLGSLKSMDELEHVHFLVKRKTVLFSAFHSRNVSVEFVWLPTHFREWAEGDCIFEASSYHLGCRYKDIFKIFILSRLTEPVVWGTRQ